MSTPADNENQPVKPGVATPPGLLLATLLFWGWQTDWLWCGAVMGVILELARRVPWRWELREEDFRRLWNFSVLLGLGLGIYLFSADDAGTGPGGTAADVARKAGLSGLNAGMTMLRVMPMLWFLFVAAQCFSTRQAVPLAAISWLVRRWQRLDGAAWKEKSANLTYPYFMTCVYSAGIHDNDGTHIYFWGQAVLLAWALWPLRARRVQWWVWLLALGVALGAGFGGARGIGRLEQVLNNYNAQWLTRMLHGKMNPDESRTSIGKIGQMKLSGEIVLRVRPDPGSPLPVYLREASYRKYNSQIWQTMGGTNDFVAVKPTATNENSWVLLPEKTRLAGVQIAAYLEGFSPNGDAEGLLPLPTGVARLDELPAFELKQNPFGAVLATGPGLMIYEARFGGGKTMDSRPDTNWDLLVPSNETNALEQVIKELNLAGMDERRQLLAIQQFFESKFTYTLFIKPQLPGHTNGTPIANFLLHSRAGYCEYFATATVLLLRELHIPARYATGYVVHETSGSGYVVRAHDAHAWCLVWDEPSGTWNNYDTTPGSETNGGGKLGQALGDAWSWVKFEFAKFKLFWGQTEFRKYALWLLIPVLGLSLYQLIFRRGRKGKPAKVAGTVPADWPGRDSEFYRLEARLAERGVPRQPGESLAPWLERVLADPARADLRTPVRELLRLHYQHRFDPEGLTPADRERLAREVAALEGKI